MALITNVTILIPGRKKYGDYRIGVEEFPNGKAAGQWSVIDFMPTPTREGYTKADLFGATKGDAFLDKGASPGYRLFFFRFNSISAAIPPGISLGYARIVMDVKEHMFSPKQATWAKKAELIPSLVEAIAIFWKSA